MMDEHWRSVVHLSRLEGILCPYRRPRSCVFQTLTSNLVIENIVTGENKMSTVEISTLHATTKCVKEK